MGLVADCTKADDAKMILDETIAKYGHVDGMINAGVHNAMPNGFGKMTEDYWKEWHTVRSCKNEVVARQDPHSTKLF